MLTPIARLAVLCVSDAHFIFLASTTARAFTSLLLALTTHLIREIAWNGIVFATFAKVVGCTPFAVTPISTFFSLRRSARALVLRRTFVVAPCTAKTSTPALCLAVSAHLTWEVARHCVVLATNAQVVWCAAFAVSAVLLFFALLRRASTSMLGGILSVVTIAAGASTDRHGVMVTEERIG